MGELATMVGSDRNTVQGFINDMVSETSNIDTPIVVNDKNKLTAASKLGTPQPVVVHDNNNDNMKLINTIVKSNNTLSVYILEIKEGCYE